MRIIAGQYGGRILETPRGTKTHPMSERVRGAMFNSLDDLTGKSVWDAFAGTGSIAIEAISRGASSALATEKDRAAFVALQQNAQIVETNQLSIVQASCIAWGKNNPQATFDLIICDPPYHDLQLSTVSALKYYLKPKGLMVVSYPGREPVPTVNGVVVVDNRNYGDAALAYYRLEATE